MFWGVCKSSGVVALKGRPMVLYQFIQLLEHSRFPNRTTSRNRAWENTTTAFGLANSPHPIRDAISDTPGNCVVDFVGTGDK